MKRLALITSLLVTPLLLTACQPDDDAQQEAGPVTMSLTDSSSPAPDASPTDAQPASPTPAPMLTADFCSEHGNDSDGPYGNSKTCYMQACEAGDQASCELMGSYNGNLEQPQPAQ